MGKGLEIRLSGTDKLTESTRPQTPKQARRARGFRRRHFVGGYARAGDVGAAGLGAAGGWLGKSQANVANRRFEERGLGSGPNVIAI